MTSAEFLTSVTVDFENRTLDIKPGYEGPSSESSSDQSTTAGAIRGGMLFSFIASVIPWPSGNSFPSRPVVVKHKSSMYHFVCGIVTEIITEFPTKFVAIVVLCLITYWIPFMKYEAGAFFQYIYIY
ncbi:ATV_HP_G0062960.mRNA.1.CDS.1 [Saccharomyces cerevisiae]|nr:ATV_HP_G0062960.mRNA.1.CDS.1 [Saccharomyces cerevisiae]CAI6998990.1 ATV_HP_G0062960.mRNA.1.CDS.1 [Saccharomyces cerevisiae]